MRNLILAGGAILLWVASSVLGPTPAKGSGGVQAPLVRSEVAFTLHDPALMATGLAVDSDTGDIYVASVRERKIVRRTVGGAVVDFVRQGQNGFLAGASLAIDPPRHLLYATTAAAPFMVGYQKGDFGQSGLFAFDLRTGGLVCKAMLPADGKRHFLNALVVDKAGNVYASDSGASGIYLLRRSAYSLEPFVPPDVFHATQGLALSADEKTLYVADWSDGLWALDLASKRPRHLDAPAGVALKGLDGLSRAGDDFISVQIGAKPERVLRLKLDPQAQRLASVDVLESGRPEYEGPVQGTVFGGAFYYVANSQLDLGDGETGAFAADRARPTVVLRLSL